MPQLFGEVELDLAQHSLIPDLDRALDTRTWHFIRSAIHRLIDDPEPSWLQKEVMARVQCRRNQLRPSDDGSGGIPTGREGSR